MERAANGASSSCPMRACPNERTVNCTGSFLQLKIGKSLPWRCYFEPSSSFPPVTSIPASVAAAAHPQEARRPGARVQTTRAGGIRPDSGAPTRGGPRPRRPIWPSILPPLHSAPPLDHSLRVSHRVRPHPLPRRVTAPPPPPSTAPPRHHRIWHSGLAGPPPPFPLLFFTSR